MAAQKGKLVLLKADLAGGSPQVYTTVAGLRTTQWSVNGEDVDVTTKDDDGWYLRRDGALVPEPGPWYCLLSIPLSAAGFVQGLLDHRVEAYVDALSREPGAA